MRRSDLSPPASLLAACLLGVCLAVGGFAGCSGWDPRQPFERNAPEVDDAIRALDAGKYGSAEEALERYLSTGPCSADGGIAVSSAVRQKHNGAFDLGLTLFYLGERYGRRFGDEESGDGGAEEEALMERRSAEVDCALAIVHAVASDPKVPGELRARARYLAGNLEFLRRKYEEAVKEYDQALAIVPGLPEDGGDAIGRDAAWNRAIALRRIEDKKDAAPDSSDGSDGSDDPDAGPDGSDGGDAGPDGNDGGQDGGDGGDQGNDGGQDAGGDSGDDQDAGDQDGGERQDSGAAPQPKEPEKAAPQQDSRMLELLEQTPSYQEQEAKKRGQIRRGRPTMEDK